MNCEDYRELLVGFQDGELSPSEESLVKKHLQECAGCAHELDEIREFAADMHAATAPIRQATSRIEEAVRAKITEAASPARRSVQFLRPVWIGWAAVVIITAGILFINSWSRPGNSKELIAWGIQHYPLVDQAHPVTGDSETVRRWFRDHHQVTVNPPQRAEYSRLTGCKMTEWNSRPVPLLRFQETPVKAVFILPPNALKNDETGVTSQDGFRVELWREGSASYMALSR